jgi:hypothetical protein
MAAHPPPSFPLDHARPASSSHTRGDSSNHTQGKRCARRWRPSGAVSPTNETEPRRGGGREWGHLSSSIAASMGSERRCVFPPHTAPPSLPGSPSVAPMGAPKCLG